jgi:hypothetical protein
MRRGMVLVKRIQGNEQIFHESDAKDEFKLMSIKEPRKLISAETR